MNIDIIVRLRPRSFLSGNIFFPIFGTVSLQCMMTTLSETDSVTVLVILHYILMTVYLSHADDERVLVILHYIPMTAYLSQMTRQFSSSFYYILMTAYRYLSQMTRQFSSSFTTTGWRHTFHRWRDSSRHSSLHPDDGIPVTNDETILFILLPHPDDGIPFADNETVLVILLLHPDVGIPVEDDETMLAIIHKILMTA